jgi:EpsD family peptidyl-prolyl cis-trans isomerase
MTRLLAMAFLALSAVPLAGCGKKAEGQVAAIVNGEEITLSEINAELGGGELPDGVDKKAARQLALQQIVQRRLVAQAARDDGLDKSPEYLIRRRALDDALLVQSLAKKVGAAVKVPDAAGIDAFIRSRPEMFANRLILTIDRIRFVPPADPALRSKLEAARSIDAIAAALKDNNVAFERTPGEVDTAQLPADAARQIMALPDGEPFILPRPNLYIAGVVTGKRAVPLTGDAARPVAVNAIRNEQLNKALERRLSAARAKAEITYQPGFAPPKENAAQKRAS